MISNKKTTHWILEPILFIIFFLAIPCMALEVETHRAINEYVADKSINLNNFSLHQYLQKQLGIQNGSEEYFNNKKVFKWIGDGGKQEDKPVWYCNYIRSINHYINPLNHTGFSGLWDTKLFQGVSAYDWAMYSYQAQYCGDYSWHDGRSKHADDQGRGTGKCG